MKVHGIVIDANILARMVRESANAIGQYSPLEIWLDKVVKCHSAVVHQLMRTEYEQTCGYEWIKYWITDKIISGQLFEVEFKVESQLKREVRRRFSTGYSDRDLCYIQAGILYEPHYILSEDRDFYDPKLKRLSRSSSKVIRAMEGREGVLCRWLLEVHGVSVGTVEHALIDLGIEMESSGDNPLT